MNNQLYREVMEEMRFSDSEKESLISKLQNEYRKRMESKHKISIPRWCAVSISVAMVLVLSVSIGLNMLFRGTNQPQIHDGYRAIGLNEAYDNGTGDTVKLTEITLCDNISYQGTDYTDSFIVLTLDMNFHEYYLNSKQVVLTYLLDNEKNVALLNTELTATLSDIGIDGNAKDISGDIYLVFTVSDELKNSYETADKDTTYWGSEMKLVMNGVYDKTYSETIFKLFYSDMKYTDKNAFNNIRGGTYVNTNLLLYHQSHGKQ